MKVNCVLKWRIAVYVAALTCLLIARKEPAAGNKSGDLSIIQTPYRGIGGMRDNQ